MTGFSDHFNPAFFDRAGRFLDAACGVYFRYQVRGLERLPAKPCLLVGNHSALGNMELACMMAGWWKRFGVSRRVTGMMHSFTIASPGVGHFYRAMGAIPASRDNALAALDAGHDVIVFPGGDLDACRPFYEPRKVHFGRRRGYVRVALAAGVPVVPLATIGSHYTMLMAPGGALLARLLGLKKLLRIERVPLPMHLIPPPVRITTEALGALDLTAATADIADEADRIEHAHQLVYATLQDGVARMQHDRPGVT